MMAGWGGSGRFCVSDSHRRYCSRWPKKKKEKKRVRENGREGRQDGVIAVNRVAAVPVATSLLLRYGTPTAG